MKACKVRNCNRKILCRGWCGMHYHRVRRIGKVGGAKPRKKLNGTYSSLIDGKQVFFDKNYLATKMKEYVRRGRKKNPDFYKSIKPMHKKRFGGLRDKVLERDGFTCQICGMTDGEHRIKWDCQITIDHIDGNGRYSDTKNHSENNLWVLCLSCHGRRDFYRAWLSRGKTVPIRMMKILRLE